MMTLIVPISSARGTFRPGSRISSAMYDAAFHPEYVNITGTSASSQLAGLIDAAACCRFALDPTPTANPAAMNTRSASTFNVASTFITARPGPTPTMCTRANSQTAIIASTVCRENVSGTYGSGMTKIGVEFAAPGINRSSTTIKKMALAAIAPAKPAMNDVHPVMNPASGPYASRRYTYSPPARGRSAASSAYAIAPKNASTPPAIHVERNHVGCGTSDATKGGENRMPPPMTLATMMAAASNGPSRLSRDVCVDEGTQLLGEHLARDLPFAQLGPLVAAVLGEHLDLSVDELAVFQHLRARFAASVPEVRPLHVRFHRAPRRDGLHPHGLEKRPAPLLRLADAPDDGVQLHVGDRLAAHVFQRQRDGGQQLVLVVLDAGIEPAGFHVDRLDELRNGFVATAPAGTHEYQESKSREESTKESGSRE